MKAAIYNASAGSGKTYHLAYKYVRDVVEQPLRYRNILAVTFTNKATEEMKKRILQQIHALASGAPSNYLEPLMVELDKSEGQVRRNAKEARALILHNYSRFTVLTIDTFFQRIVRAFIQELGRDIGYTLEIESSSIVEQGADAIIEQITEDEELRSWLMSFIKERVDQNRKWDIREGILSLSSKLFDQQSRLAIESSMSREQMQQFIDERSEKCRQTLKRLKELGERGVAVIANGGCTHLDFKGKRNSFAKVFYYFADIDGDKLPDITKTAREKSLSTDGWCDASSDALSLVPQLQPILQEIVELYDESVVQINTTTLLRQNYRSFVLLADLYAKTLHICEEQNTMLLNQTATILEAFVTEQDAPFIYEKVGNKYTHFMIDEFQDTSAREWNNFLPLLRNAISEAEHDASPILIVGDIKQSIYRWRGGDWRLLYSQAQSDLGYGNSEVVTLRSNYRSHRNIVRFNNAMIDGVVALQDKELNETLALAYEQGMVDKELYGELSGVIRRAYTDQAQEPMRKVESGKSEGFVEVVSHTQSEVPIISRICEAIDRGYAPSDILILTRSNTQAAEVAQQLLAFKQEIHGDAKRLKYNFNVMTQEALVVGYAPVSSFIIAVMRLSMNPKERLQRAIYNQFLGREYADSEIPTEELEMLSQLRLYSLIEVFEKICMTYHLDDNRDNIAYLQAIHEQIINFSGSKIGDIELYLDWWDKKGRDRSLSVQRSRDAIEVMTIHKAKGLERRVVMIPYAAIALESQSNGRNKNTIWASEQGDSTHLYPIDYSLNMANSAFAADYYREKVYAHLDAINLLYVALTRAAESLHIFVKATTLKSGQRSYQKLGKVLMAAIPTLSVNMVTEEQEDGVISYQYGQPVFSTVDNDSHNRHYIMERYASNHSKLLLSMPSTPYREDNSGSYSPRKMGVLLHKAFEQAVTLEDIHSNIERMMAAGEIDIVEQQEIVHSIEKSLKDPIAAQWFSDDWDSIRNESNIIRPMQDGKHRRPDRVMIKGERAVVVDYKFGEHQAPQHERQVKLYIHLLQEMGYEDCTGFVWYPRIGLITQC